MNRKLRYFASVATGYEIGIVKRCTMLHGSLILFNLFTQQHKKDYCSLERCVVLRLFVYSSQHHCYSGERAARNIYTKMVDSSRKAPYDAETDRNEKRRK